MRHWHWNSIMRGRNAHWGTNSSDGGSSRVTRSTLSLPKVIILLASAFHWHWLAVAALAVVLFPVLCLGAVVVNKDAKVIEKRFVYSEPPSSAELSSIISADPGKGFKVLYLANGDMSKSKDVVEETNTVTAKMSSWTIRNKKTGIQTTVYFDPTKPYVAYINAEYVLQTKP